MPVMPDTRDRCVKPIVTLRDPRTGEYYVNNLRWWPGARLEPSIETLEDNRGWPGGSGAPSGNDRSLWTRWTMDDKLPLDFDVSKGPQFSPTLLQWMDQSKGRHTQCFGSLGVIHPR
jgi:hypothetical protein